MLSLLPQNIHLQLTEQELEEPFLVSQLSQCISDISRTLQIIKCKD